MIRCPRCGAKNKDSATYCNKCRFPLRRLNKKRAPQTKSKKPKRNFKLPNRFQNINKKHLFIVIAVIIIIAISCLYMFGDKHVDVGGVKFTIPNQFNEKYSDKILNYTGNNSNPHISIDYNLKVYEDNKGNKIVIDVSSPTGKQVFSEDALDKDHPGTSTTINDQKGYFINSTQYKYAFEYVKYGKLVCIRGNDLKLIESII